MRVRVRFRFNTRTGEVELFQVDDLGGGAGAAHEAEHDEISAELGAVVARRPEVQEVTGAADADWAQRLPGVPGQGAATPGEEDPEELPDARETW